MSPGETSMVKWHFQTPVNQGMPTLESIQSIYSESCQGFSEKQVLWKIKQEGDWEDIKPE